LLAHPLPATQLAECKAAVEEGAAELEALPEPDPSVSAEVHYVSSLYYKVKKDYAKFYRSSMQVRGFGGRGGGRRVEGAAAAAAAAARWAAGGGRGGRCRRRLAALGRRPGRRHGAAAPPPPPRRPSTAPNRPAAPHAPPPTLQYLAFVSSDTLPPDFKLPLAVDIGLAALLGDGVYGFAQLLMHPIVKVLQAGQYAWLGEMLEVFNR
jgi:hypothetical protein